MFGDLSYTGKDIATIREEVMEYIKEHDPNYTDYNESSLQLQYVDILSGVVDLMCYYLDNQTLETYLSTARQEKNIRNILSMMNYEIPNMDTAKGSVSITRSVKQYNDSGIPDTYLEGRISIPKYTAVYHREDPVHLYLTAESAMLTREMSSVRVPVVQGSLKTLKVPYDTLRSSFKVYLTDSKIPVKYVEIVDENWVKCEDAFLEVQGGQKYSVHVDSKNRVYLMFTFNWKNYIPNEINGFLEIRYIETLGTEGKVDAHYLNTLGKGAIDIDSGIDVSSSLIVDNESATYGAFDKPNLNEQKANARNWLKTYDRIVTIKDFETMLRKYPWVRDCYVADWRTNGTLVQYPHEAKAWIVTTDGAIINDTEAFEQIQKELQDKTVMMTALELLPADFVTTTWKIGISVIGAFDDKKLAIRQKVEEKLKSMYSLSEFCKGNENSKLKFNMEIRRSLIEAEIINTSDCIVDVDVPIDDITQLTENQFLNVEKIEVYLM